MNNIIYVIIRMDSNKLVVLDVGPSFVTLQGAKTLYTKEGVG